MIDQKTWDRMCEAKRDLELKKKDLELVTQQYELQVVTEVLMPLLRDTLPIWVKTGSAQGDHFSNGPVDDPFYMSLKVHYDPKDPAIEEAITVMNMSPRFRFDEFVIDFDIYRLVDSNIISDVCIGIHLGLGANPKNDEEGHICFMHGLKRISQFIMTWAGLETWKKLNQAPRKNPADGGA